jgi:hypothetical protein
MSLDQLPYIVQGVVVEVTLHGSSDHGLDLGRRHTGDRCTYSRCDRAMAARPTASQEIKPIRPIWPYPFFNSA